MAHFTGRCWPQNRRGLPRVCLGSARGFAQGLPRVSPGACPGVYPGDLRFDASFCRKGLAPKKGRVCPGPALSLPRGSPRVCQFSAQGPASRFTQGTCALMLRFTCYSRIAFWEEEGCLCLCTVGEVTPLPPGTSCVSGVCGSRAALNMDTFLCSRCGLSPERTQHGRLPPWEVAKAVEEEVEEEERVVEDKETKGRRKEEGEQKRTEQGGRGGRERDRNSKNGRKRTRERKRYEKEEDEEQEEEEEEEEDKGREGGGQKKETNNGRTKRRPTRRGQRGYQQEEDKEATTKGKTKRTHFFVCSQA